MSAEELKKQEDKQIDSITKALKIQGINEN